MESKELKLLQALVNNACTQQAIRECLEEQDCSGYSERIECLIFALKGLRREYEALQIQYQNAPQFTS